MEFIEKEKKMKRFAALILALSIGLSMNVVASAAMPESFFGTLQIPTGIAELLNVCPHAWTASAVGSESYRWNERDQCIHRYHTFIYVCIRCGDYYYSDVDLGPA